MAIPIGSLWRLAISGCYSRPEGYWLSARSSRMTKNQIIAGAATFGVCLMLWVLEWVAGYETAPWAKVLAYMSVISHFESFSKGVLDSKDAVFYASMIFLGLFLTSRSMESLRWRS